LDEIAEKMIAVVEGFEFGQIEAAYSNLLQTDLK